MTAPRHLGTTLVTVVTNPLPQNREPQMSVNVTPDQRWKFWWRSTSTLRPPGWTQAPTSVSPSALKAATMVGRRVLQSRTSGSLKPASSCGSNAVISTIWPLSIRKTSITWARNRPTNSLVASADGRST